MDILLQLKLWAYFLNPRHKKRARESFWRAAGVRAVVLLPFFSWTLCVVISSTFAGFIYYLREGRESIGAPWATWKIDVWTFNQYNSGQNKLQNMYLNNKIHTLS